MADWSSYLSSAGSLLGGVGSFIGNLFGSGDDTYEDQRALMAQNNRFQAEENEKSRLWQLSMYDRQWQDYMDYNDPSALVDRLQSAGVSPASAFQSMSTSGTASSMPSPSSPGHSAVPSPDYAGTINPINQKAAAFSSISQGLQALANARKVGIEGSFVGSQMQAYIKSLMSESDYKDVLADQQKYEVELRRKYGDKMLNSQVHELAMKAYQEEQLAKFYIRQEDVQKAEAALNRAKEAHERVMKRLTKAQAEQYEIDNRFREAYNQASINELRSRSGMQSAQARQATAQAVNTEFMNELQQRPDVKYSLIKELRMAGQQAEAANKMTKAQTEQLDWACKQLEKATDNYEIQMWSGIINQFINTAANAVGEFTKFGLAKKFLNEKPSSIEPGNGYYLNNDGLLFKRP